MRRIAYIDIVGGAAGDMLLAALLDAGAPLAAVRDAVEAVVPGRFAVATAEVRRAGLRARLLLPGDEPGPGGHPRGGTRTQRGRRFADLLAALGAASLDEGVRERARRVLTALGEAESRVHGADVAGLVVGELGDDDTLLDAVGVAAALEALEIDRIAVSPVPLGRAGAPGGKGGGDEIGHELPGGHGREPAGGHGHGAGFPPVTLELLRGFDVRGEGEGETVTPTGAAILAALGEPVDAVPPMTLEAVGVGAGTREVRGTPNVVRVLLGRPSPAPGRPADWRTRELVVLEANVDDLTPELASDAAEALLHAGALDAWTVPIHMKKGRPGLLLAALGEPDQEAVLARVLFEATPTLGVRSHRVSRHELDRRSVAVPLAGGTVRVKLGLLGDRIVTARPEHDDVAALAAQTGRSVRDVYEEASGAARALVGGTAGSPAR